MLGSAKDNRLFVEAVLWIARTGSPWRDLLEEYGHWHKVYVRFNRWSHKGVWDKVFEELSKEGDFEYVMIDGSIVRVHQHGTAERVQQDEQAQGKSVGGLSPKIHAAVDALGNSIKLTRGQDSEVKQAQALIKDKDFDMDYLLADKAYDLDSIIQFIEDSGAIAVIPPKKTKISKRV